MSKPLKQGFWIGNEEHRVFVVVLYEKLPTFCYLCGMVGHGSNSCNRRSSVNHVSSYPPPSSDTGELQGSAVRMNLDAPATGLEARSNPLPVDSIESSENNLSQPDTDFGPLMLVSRRRGRGGGRGGTRGGARSGEGRSGARAAHTLSPNPNGAVTVDAPLHSSPARSPHGGSSIRGRGGHAGGRQSTFA